MSHFVPKHEMTEEDIKLQFMYLISITLESLCIPTA